MQPARSELFQYRLVHILVALHDLLSPFWNRELGNRRSLGTL
jgi:hypothetical protein